MPRGKRTVRKIVAEIKRINAQFRKRDRMAKAEEDLLMGQKDLLIDEMAEICDHPSVIGMRGKRRKGRPSIGARRICTKCGHCESRFDKRGFRQLAGRPLELLPYDEYLVREGRLLIDLGINIRN